MKTNNKGQAAILIIFVIGMVGLLIGMTLSKTGFSESMMGRGTAGSTKAFYIANAGIEDAFYKIQMADEEEIDINGTYELTVGDGSVKVTISGDNKERKMISVGKFENFVRKISVTTFNTTINPGFIRVIQASEGGLELHGGTEIIGDVYSNSYIKAKKNGKESGCSKPASDDFINGSAWAVDYIGKIDKNDEGPCISGNAYTGNLNECRVFGNVYFDNDPIDADCPYEPSNICDPDEDPDNCKTPIKEDLPDIEPSKMRDYLYEEGQIYPTLCEIGGDNDCSTEYKGVPTIGDIVIQGDLISKVPLLYISGPVYVEGNIDFSSKQDIKLAPDLTENSQILLAHGKIVTNSNVIFYSEGNKFLLVASEHENVMPNVCENEDDAAITIASNVENILFFALNGCVLVSSNNSFYGALLGTGIRINNNSTVEYDPNLKDAKFSISKDGGWQITSFTEE